MKQNMELTAENNSRYSTYRFVSMKLFLPVWTASNIGYLLQSLKEYKPDNVLLCEEDFQKLLKEVYPDSDPKDGCAIYASWYFKFYDCYFQVNRELPLNTIEIHFKKD